MNETERLKARIKELEQETAELKIQNMQLRQMSQRMVIDKSRLLKGIMESAVDQIYGKEA